MSSAKTTVCSLLLATALTGALSAQQHPSHERGFDPEKLYQFSDLDSVNLLNGNLTLAIPIGMRYPVGGGLTYGLTLTYNSKAWDHQEVYYQGNPKSQALPGRLANAGLGWTLSLGRLLAPEDALNDYEAWQWVYIGPDGAEHVFYAGLHDSGPPGTDPCGSLCYTRDGSYLRLRTVHAGLRIVEFPDGQQHHFTLVFFNGLPTWRLTEIRDRFEDGERDVEIFYLQEDFLWEIWDKHGRRHRVVFESDPAGGGKPRLQRVEFSLNAVDTPAATYTFSYLPPQWVTVPCSHTYPGGTSVQVSLLSSLFLPDGPSNGALADGSKYGFQYYYGAASSGTCYARGVLSDLILPTLGKLHYTYRQHTLPITGCSYQEWHSHSAAIATRQLLGAAGDDLGTWTYTATLSDPPPVGALRCEPLTPKAFSPPSEQLKVEVLTPLKDRSAHFFSVYPGAEPGFPRSAISSELDYGLPFGRIAPAGPDNTGTRYLSTQVFDCNETTGACPATAKRSAYVRYERDSSVACAGQLTVNCMNSNRRLASERTVYHDDADRFADLDSSDFDGFGHYRTVAARGSFPADWRTSFTNYNPGNVLPGTAWLLNTYTEQTVEEDGVKAKVQACFDSANGFLRRRRSLAQTNAAPGPATNDVLVVYTPDLNGTGDVTREDWYGGDVQGLSTAVNLCALSLPSTTQYAMVHSYQGGSLATSQYRDANDQAPGALAFYTVDRTIDPTTGLPSSSRDAAGIEERYTYDALGRLKTVEPVGALRDAPTTYTYCTASLDPTCGAKAEVVVARTTVVGGSEITALRYRFDDLGRLISEAERMPPSGAYEARTFAYNGMGWRTFVSEQGAPGGTSYLDYDPFGRPGKIRPADSVSPQFEHDISLSYLGARQVERTVKVSLTAGAQETPATTTEVYDRNGRLVEVTEPNGVKTRYDYDAGSRLKKVCQNATGSGTDTCGQARLLTYDNRGFLLSEQHPEKGVNGNGIVTYSNYNARGHAEQRIDGANNLTFSYDRAERLVRVRESGTGFVDCVNNNGHRCLKTFDYGTGATDPSKGKVKTTKRYNYVGAPFNATVEVEETYTYGGRGGRVSQQDTQMIYNGALSEKFRQSPTWNTLGDLSTQSYPDCIAGSCASLDTPRTVSFNYSYGRLVTVPGFTGTATTTTGATVSQITYHPNGTVFQVPHANQMLYTVGRDPQGMARPAFFQANRGSTTYWNTSTHTYDGAGNLEATGEFGVRYDTLSRVLQMSTLLGNSQSYTYDAYGNILSVTTNTSTVNTPTLSGSNHLTMGTYDAAGNLITWMGTSYEYDAFNQLKRRHRSGAEDWRYIYTADDERFWSYRVGGGGSIWSLRGLDGQVLRRYDAHVSWGTYDDYVYRDGQLLAAAHTPVAPAPKTGMWHFHLDHLGTPRMVTNANGASIGFHRYYPFGQEETALQEGEVKKFTSHERDLFLTADTEDDLDYMHARHCSPLTGRFLSIDPIGGNSHAPQSWNRYAYVLGNPLKYLDPYGLAINCGVIKQSGSGGYASLNCSETITVTTSLLGGLQSSPVLLSHARGSNAFSREFGGGLSLPTTAELQVRAAAGDENAMHALGMEIPGLEPVAGPIEIGIFSFAGLLRRALAGTLSGIRLWPSPSAGSGTVTINGVTYTQHALERMAPVGLIQKGTELVSRGIPPSVVENAIRHGAKTAGRDGAIVHTFENVRVITDGTATRVLSVIKIGR